MTTDTGHTYALTPAQRAIVQRAAWGLLRVSYVSYMPGTTSDAVDHYSREVDVRITKIKGERRGAVRKDSVDKLIREGILSRPFRASVVRVTEAGRVALDGRPVPAPVAVPAPAPVETTVEPVVSEIAEKAPEEKTAAQWNGLQRAAEKAVAEEQGHQPRRTPYESTDIREAFTSEDGGLSFQLFRLPDDCESETLLAEHAKKRDAMEKAVAKRDKGAPEWKPFGKGQVKLKSRKAPKTDKTPADVVKAWAGEVIHDVACNQCGEFDCTCVREVASAILANLGGPVVDADAVARGRERLTGQTETTVRHECADQITMGEDVQESQRAWQVGDVVELGDGSEARVREVDGINGTLRVAFNGPVAGTAVVPMDAVEFIRAYVAPAALVPAYDTPEHVTEVRAVEGGYVPACACGWVQDAKPMQEEEWARGRAASHRDNPFFDMGEPNPAASVVLLPEGIPGVMSRYTRVLELHGATAVVATSAHRGGRRVAVAKLTPVEVPHLYLPGDRPYLGAAWVNVDHMPDPFHIVASGGGRLIRTSDLTPAEDMPPVVSEELGDGWTRCTVMGETYESVRMPDRITNGRGKWTNLTGVTLDASGALVGRTFNGADDESIYWAAAHPGTLEDHEAGYVSIGEGRRITELMPLTEEERAYLAAGPQPTKEKVKKAAETNEQGGESTVGRGSMAPKRKAAAKVGDIVFSAKNTFPCVAKILGHTYVLRKLAGTFSAQHEHSDGARLIFEGEDPKNICRTGGDAHPNLPAVKRAILADAVARGESVEEQVEPAAEERVEPAPAASWRDVPWSQRVHQSRAHMNYGEEKNRPDFVPGDLVISSWEEASTLGTVTKVYTCGRWVADVTWHRAQGDTPSSMNDAANLIPITREEFESFAKPEETESNGHRARIYQAIASKRTGKFRVTCVCENWMELVEPGQSRATAWRATLEEARELFAGHAAGEPYEELSPEDAELMRQAEEEYAEEQEAAAQLEAEEAAAAEWDAEEAPEVSPGYSVMQVNPAGDKNDGTEGMWWAHCDGSREGCYQYGHIISPDRDTSFRETEESARALGEWHVEGEQGPAPTDRFPGQVDASRVAWASCAYEFVYRAECTECDAKEESAGGKGIARTAAAKRRAVRDAAVAWTVEHAEQHQDEESAGKSPTDGEKNLVQGPGPAGESVEVPELADTAEIPVKPQPTPGLYAPVLQAEERTGEDADECRAAGHRYVHLVVEAEGVSRTLRSYLTCTCTGEKLGNFSRSGPSMNQGTQTKPLGIRDASIASALGVAKRNSYTTQGPWQVMSDTLKRCPVEWDHAKPVPVAVDPAREKKTSSVSERLRAELDALPKATPGHMAALLEQHVGPDWKPLEATADPVFAEEEEERQAPVQGLAQVTPQQREAAMKLAGRTVEDLRAHAARLEEEHGLTVPVPVTEEEPRGWFAPVVAPSPAVEEEGALDYAAISRANRAAAVVESAVEEQQEQPLEDLSAMDWESLIAELAELRTETRGGAAFDWDDVAAELAALRELTAEGREEVEEPALTWAQVEQELTELRQEAVPAAVPDPVVRTIIPARLARESLSLAASAALVTLAASQLAEVMPVSV